MAGFTDSEERRLLDLMATGGYLALLTADTSDETPTITEVTGGTYARLAASGYLAAASTTSGTTTKKNSTAVQWDGLPACTVVGVALFDAITTGNDRASISFTGITVASGDSINIPINGLVFSLD